MKPTTVVYHKSDFDGLFCREIARKFLPDAEFIGWDHGDPCPNVDLDRTLYILDLSVPDLMMHPGLIWIDHHATAIAKYPKDIPGYRIDGVAACRLTWQWFFFQGTPEGRPFVLPMRQDFLEHNVREPWSVRLAGEYDVWDKRDPDAELFQHGLRSRDISNMWPLILEMDKHMPIAEIENLKSLDPDGTIGILKPDGTARNPHVCGLLRAGKHVQYAQTQANETIIKTYGFTFLWEGLVWLACNSALYNSALFTSALKPEHDACFAFKFTGRDWMVTLYHAPGKEHHDLSKIAEKYGGGGHKGACGYRTQKVPDFL